MKSVRIDMTGQRFGRLLVESYSTTNKDGKAMWICVCDCGKRCEVSGKYMRAGLTNSCGCLHRELIGKVRLTHGMSRTLTHGIWATMITRCTNPNHKSWSRYGGAGISVCDRWRSSFAAFLEDMGECPPGKTLERENPFGNYEPSNCCWATRDKQVKNTRGQAAIRILERMGISPAKAFEEGYTRISG